MEVMDYKKEHFYRLFEERKSDYSDEIVHLVESGNSGANSSNNCGLFELCKHYSFIGVNAPRHRIGNTCEVQGCFQFEDIDRAIAETLKFISDNQIEDVNGLMTIIHDLHGFTADDDANSSGMVRPMNYGYGNGYGGKFYNFAQLPDDIFEEIKEKLMQKIGE